MECKAWTQAAEIWAGKERGLKAVKAKPCLPLLLLTPCSSILTVA
jgi:hypothetical protein